MSGPAGIHGPEIYSVQFGRGPKFVALWRDGPSADAIAGAETLPVRCQSPICERKGEPFDALTDTFALIEHELEQAAVCERCGQDMEAAGEEFVRGSIEHRVLQLICDHPLASDDELADRLYGESVSYADRQELSAAIARLVDWELIVQAPGLARRGDG